MIHSVKTQKRRRTLLTVYKASAGSGKTFRLAVEYIKKLIISPVSYEGILAVTFTNKATEEMKMRILSQLYGLAYSLPDSNPYLNVMLPELQKENEETPFADTAVDAAFVRRRAAIALRNLLHNYHQFRVETIDKFFQSVLRNLARELDLTPNLRVEIRDAEVVEEAVDRWIDKLSEGDKQMGWILDYIRHSMDDEKSWNIIGKIKSFGKVLLSDEYKQISSQLNKAIEKIEFGDFIKLLRREITEGNEKLNRKGKELIALAESNGVDLTSLAQKEKGVGGFILKMPKMKITELATNSYVTKALNADDTNADAWVGKKGVASVREVCRTLLKPALQNAMRELEQARSHARSAKVTLNNLSALQMLHAIEGEIWQNNREQNTFLLSDTQILLSKMIGEYDSPFIFEKIGARLKSIMIDEFQDTSTIQWKNFKVLLDDCMSHGYKNLIVGDVKQSIYRWRSGDWRLLNNIETAFSEEELSPQSLRTNRRSAVNVIRFNNMFFKKAIEKITGTGEEKTISEMLVKAYADVEQDYPENKKHEGYVEVKMIEKGDSKEDTVKYVFETVTMLVEKGFAQSDIAVLVRTRSDIALIVKECMEAFARDEREEVRQLKFVSDEAFLLSNSYVANILIDALRLLVNPDDVLAKARLTVNYEREILHNNEPQEMLLREKGLPKCFTNNYDSLRKMPLYQVCEQLCILLSLTAPDDQCAYLCSFFDNLCEFSERNTADAASFLKYWDESMRNKKIESDSTDGIRILTIHKSKGLEYKNVIVPFCDWQLEKETLVWCKTSEVPFSTIPYIPVSVNKKELENTIFYNDYLVEHLQNTVDNINLLYVAFTRAVDNLFITAEKGQKETYRGWLIEEVINNLDPNFGAHFKNDTMTFGELLIKERKKEQTENIFMQPTEPLQISVVTNAKEPDFRESNQSKAFTLADDDEEGLNRERYITMGNILHFLFSNIRSWNDIDDAIKQLEMDGMLYNEEISPTLLRKHIEKAFRNETAKRWFDPEWTVFNECTILEYDARNNTYCEHRPDRVITNGTETIVIDFKLYSLKDSYTAQVQRYMQLLKKMGHSNIHGFLWAIVPGKIKEIKAK